MDRVQKRCFAASVTLHGVLIGIVLFGSAFFAANEKTETIPVLTFIPDIVTDGRFVGGGGRGSGTPATPPNRVQQPPVARQPNPAPVTPPRAIVRQPSPPPTREPSPVRENNSRVAPPVVADRRQSRIQLPEEALKPVERGGKKANVRKAPRTAPRTVRSGESPVSSVNTARGQLATRIQDSIYQISSGTAPGTTVESPGDGTGGPSYAPYAAVIKAIYDREWVSPEDLHDDSAIADVEIEVARDGTVLSHRFIRRSGNARMDRSVLDVLNRVHLIEKFPASWREERRTFQIRFDLKQKEQLLG